MKLLFALGGLLLWAAPLLAETYSWVDQNGTYNYTEDYSRVPKKYRSRVGKQGDMGASPVSKGSASPATGSSVASPADLKNTPVGKRETSVETPGDKSYEQWKQDFSERESALGAIRKHVDEIDALLNKRPPNREQAQSLLSERNRAVEQFSEMRKQYDQQVELARKAGFQVNITQ